MLKLRSAKPEHIKFITEIYNEAILKTNATFDIETKTVEDMKEWFNNHSLKNPIIVALYNNTVVAWAALSKYDSKKAYSNTTELSLYVLEDFQGKGIGNKLIKEILNKGKKSGVHVVLARITEGNNISIKLHEKYGFEKIGTLKEVGIKFGKLLDVHIFEKIL